MNCWMLSNVNPDGDERLNRFKTDQRSDKGSEGNTDFYAGKHYVFKY